MATNKPKVPKVRIARPKGRPFQLRYTCPVEGREVRISTKSRDEYEVMDQKRKLEAKLLLGIDSKPRRRIAAGPNMAWEDFRERYSELQLSTLRDSSAENSEYRLDVAQRIAKPRTLADMADRDTLHDLQNRMLAGDHECRARKNKKHKPRSPHTVQSYMAVVLAALHWAEYMGWLPAVPKVRKVKVSKLKHMKGRPIALEEFERMLYAVPKVVGDEAAPSWRFLLRGLWESGLRIGELLDVSWDDASCIMPVWRRGALPVLAIPHAKQKNATEEAIPLLPGFDELLQETLPVEQQGFAFNPASLQKWPGRPERPSTKWAARVVGRIGEKAGVIVEPGKDDAPAKCASAHDLRRSCAERLIDAGVPEREVSQILRHASVETTRRHYRANNVQKAAGKIRQYLGTSEVAN